MQYSYIYLSLELPTVIPYTFSENLGFPSHPAPLLRRSHGSGSRARPATNKKNMCCW